MEFYESEMERAGNFRRHQLERFNKRVDFLRADLEERKATYRDFPTDGRQKTIEHREAELRKLENFIDANDPEMQRNYREEIDELCEMLATMGRAFEQEAPAQYIEFLSNHGKIKCVLDFHS